MTRTLRYLLLLVFTGLAGSAIAQEISGTVLDDKKQPMVSVAVQVFQGGILKGGDVTDIDGKYTVKPLDAGNYNVLVSYPSYDSIMVTNVVVTPGERTVQNFTMSLHAIDLSKGKKAFEVIAYKKPLIDHEKTATVLTREEIKVIPTTETNDLVGLTPGVYQSQRGGDAHIGGGRNTGTLYIIDGVQVQGLVGTNMSQGSIEQMEVITSGIPANYGDVSGGIVNITSRGVAPKLTGDVHLQHSIDGYNNNLANFSIAGPIYKKKVTDGDRVYKKPVIGFALSGDFYYDNDRYPSYNEDYVANPTVLKAMQQNPLKIISDNSGQPVYNYSSDYITQSQLVASKIPPKDVIREYRLNGKINYQIADNMQLAAGGMIDYVKTDDYNRGYTIFAPGGIPVSNTNTSRAFLKFTQKFGKPNDTASRHSIISNAYYSIQADYQNLFLNTQDPTFKHNLFEYGYVGTFTENRTKIYFPNQTDSASGRVGTILLGSQNTGINYTPSNLNPGLSAYTTEFYNYNSANGVNLPTSIQYIQAKNAMANGDEPLSTYGIVASPGATLGGYSYSSSSQYALTVDASFDLLIGKTKHAIGFGLYYQQRVEKGYSATENPGSGTNSLWQLTRNLVSSYNSGNLVLDKTHPIFVVNGKQYTLDDVKAGKIIPGPTDTIIYNYTNNGSGEGNNKGNTFDQNLRKKLNINNPDSSINVDAVNPNNLSLNMFSADELLNGGSGFVGYYGYNYTGGNQGSVNFNDFWTAKDGNGNYTRPIAAFSPNYLAGYLLDKFTFKDIHFNIGVRVDRYDANTEVLIDPYSEYPEKHVSQVSGQYNTYNGGQHPANIGGDYVVYVADNNSATPNIIGYRNGVNWYDPKGNYIQDPALLTNFSGGRPPQPLIVNPKSHITDTNFNPNLSFTNYAPQVHVQPRLQFSFPISENADFYAHYDIYSQRPYPSAYSIATPITYYYLSQNANSTIPNSNLKPEETIDYEVGFQQKLSSSSKLSLSAFYKERKDQVTIVPYLYAWPASYFTYGNRDFSTTKGSTLNYDLRATNHLRMMISYTLQFAEGTGSTPDSRNGIIGQFIAAGEPQGRYITALDYDSRHMLSGTIEYRYHQGEGPLVHNKHIFQNAGINLVPTARSGEPYTAFANAQGSTVIGGVNGSRLPWHYNMNLRADKDFAINGLKKHNNAPEGIKPKRPLFITAILSVNNLLNTADILHVYGYTGKPNDNGYLSSPFGQQYVPQQVNPSSYTTLYKFAVNTPGYYNYARTINFALEFSF